MVSGAIGQQPGTEQGRVQHLPAGHQAHPMGKNTAYTSAESRGVDAALCGSHPLFS